MAEYKDINGKLSWKQREEIRIYREAEEKPVELKSIQIEEKQVGV